MAIEPGKRINSTGSSRHILSKPQPPIRSNINADAHLVQGGAEQMDAVPAAERLVRHAFMNRGDASPGSWIGTRQTDILAAVAIAGKTFIGDTLVLRHTIGTGMAEAAVILVPTVQQCTRSQRSIPCERRQSTGRPIVVDQLEELRSDLLRLRRDG